MRIINWKKIARFACQQASKQLSDDLGRFYFLRELAGYLRPDYRFKWPDVDWWQDEEFNHYLDRFGELGGMNSDRRWMLRELLRLVANVPGDTAECGVYRGASSYLMCLANRDSSLHEKTHHMFDSFEGLSTPSEQDGSHWSEGDLTCGLELVKQNLQEFSATAYYPGWIPARFDDVADCRFSFVHIDVDLYEPTRDSIAFFYPRMNPGGILLCDDYAIGSCPGATRAADELLSDKPEKMMRLSGGAGFFIKGMSVADTNRLHAKLSGKPKASTRRDQAA